MSGRMQTDTAIEAPHVSTGRLPSADKIKALIAGAHARYKSNTEAENSQVYPALARVPGQPFGICMVETSGDWLYEIGLSGKSRIVAVSPGKGGLGTFAPPLDRAGNRVKGQLVARFLPQ